MWGGWRPSEQGGRVGPTVAAPASACHAVPVDSEASLGERVLHRCLGSPNPFSSIPPHISFYPFSLSPASRTPLVGTNLPKQLPPPGYGDKGALVAIPSATTVPTGTWNDEDGLYGKVYRALLACMWVLGIGVAYGYSVVGSLVVRAGSRDHVTGQTRTGQTSRGLRGGDRVAGGRLRAWRACCGLPRTREARAGECWRRDRIFGWRRPGLRRLDGHTHSF